MIHKQEINLNFLKSIKLNTWIRSRCTKNTIKIDEFIPYDESKSWEENIRLGFRPSLTNYYTSVKQILSEKIKKALDSNSEELALRRRYYGKTK